jgi:hypothetical protein
VSNSTPNFFLGAAPPRPTRAPRASFIRHYFLLLFINEKIFNYALRSTIFLYAIRAAEAQAAENRKKDFSGKFSRRIIRFLSVEKLFCVRSSPTQRNTFEQRNSVKSCSTIQFRFVAQSGSADYSVELSLVQVKGNS